MDPRVLTDRTATLVEALRDRLGAKDYEWAFENARQTEWELALATIHDSAAAGEFAMTDAEASELFALEALVDRRMMQDLVRRRPERVPAEQQIAAAHRPMHRLDPITRLLGLLLLGTPLSVWAVLSQSIWVVGLALGYFGVVAWWVSRQAR